LRIGTLTTLDSGGVDTASVNSRSDDVVARPDGEYRFMRTGERVVEFFGFEVMRFSEGGARERKEEGEARERS
jgi:hypothetical protein